MPIPGYSGPTPDYPNGYVIQNTDWNGNFDALAAYLNTYVQPNINTLLAQGTPTVGAQLVVGTRLIVGLTNQNFNADIMDSANTVCLLPFIHDQLGLYNTTSQQWELKTVLPTPASGSPNPTSVVLTGGAGSGLYMIFAYWDSGSSQVKLQAIPSSGAFTFSAIGGANAVLTLSGNPFGGPAANSWQYVQIGQVIWPQSSGGAQNECAVITAINSGSNQITVDFLANSYIAGSGFSVDTTTTANALALQNGVYVLASDKSRRFMGMASIWSGFNQYGFPGQQTGIWDTVLYRGLANYYNTIPRVVGSANPNTNWAQAIGFQQPSAATRTIGVERAVMTLCQPTLLDISRSEYQTTASVSYNSQLIYPANALFGQQGIWILGGSSTINPTGWQSIGPAPTSFRQPMLVDASKQPIPAGLTVVGGRVAVQDVCSNQVAITWQGSSTAYNAGAAVAPLSQTMISYMA